MSEFIIKHALLFLESHGVNFSFHGNERIVITHPCGVGTADSHALCFFRQEDFGEFKHLPSINNLFILSKKTEKAILPEGNYIFSDKPDLCFCIVASLLLPKREPSIHPTSIISSTAVIGQDITIGAFVCIGDDVVLGDGVIIEDNCVVNNADIGQNTHIYPGVTIGSSGLGSHMDDTGKWHDFPHFGKVIIGSNVVIQDNTVINRGTLGDTVLQDGVRVGPLCWIGHAVVIGKNSFISQGVTIAGSASIGEGARIWGNAAIRDRVSIGKLVTVGMGSVVVSNIPADEVWVGNPAKRRK